MLCPTICYVLMPTSRRSFLRIHLELLIYIWCISKFRPSCKTLPDCAGEDLFAPHSSGRRNEPGVRRSVGVPVPRLMDSFWRFYDSLGGRCLHSKIDGRLVHILLLLPIHHERERGRGGEGEREATRGENEPKKKRESPWRIYGMAVSDLESYAVRQRVKSRETARMRARSFKIKFLRASRCPRYRYPVETNRNSSLWISLSRNLRRGVQVVFIDWWFSRLSPISTSIDCNFGCRSSRIDIESNFNFIEWSSRFVSHLGGLQSRRGIYVYFVACNRLKIIDAFVSYRSVSFDVIKISSRSKSVVVDVIDWPLTWWMIT